VPLWSFTIGDVFAADDPLAVWAATLGLAFNDLIHTNIKVERARTEWESLYEWRIATGHYNEACLHLIRNSSVAEVEQFLASESKVHELHDNTLRRYESLKRLTNRVRNEAAFHYAYKSGQRALARALRELASTEGAVGGAASTKIKDSRQLYADDIASQLVLNAAGGSLESYREAMAELGEGVATFASFANHALDAYFARHQRTLQLVAMPPQKKRRTPPRGSASRSGGRTNRKR
jgi:hypothetical protein